MRHGKTVRVESEVVSAVVINRDELLILRDGVRRLAADLTNTLQEQWESDAMTETYKRALSEAEALQRSLNEVHLEMDRALLTDDSDSVVDE